MEYKEGVSLEEFLPVFIREHASSNEFTGKLQKAKLWKQIISELSSESLFKCHLEALTTLKILSREKRDLIELVDKETIRLLLHHGLQGSQDASRVEALSCLSNLLLQVGEASSLMSEESVLHKHFNAKQLESIENKPTLLLLLRIGVILTIMKPATRDVIATDCREALLRLYEGFLSSQDEEGIIEASKFIYNLWAGQSSGGDLHYEKAASLLKKTLIVFGGGRSDKVLSNSINLLSALPSTHYGTLLEASSEEETFEEGSMVVPRECLNYLLRQLDKDQDFKLEENISPSLMLLVQLCRNKRIVRKYLRGIILPPLRDVKNRPEIGNTPRNKLCKLLTSPSSSIEALSSEFIFVLCKEQVDRMVKYTGFGNAAGLLARKGLLCSKGSTSDYSDEDDSDTEEYVSNSHKINPVLGCIEKPHPSPFEGMSEEQKEYEAMKLVGIIDKLNNQGLIRPAMPGPDGKLVPVEHILQMTEGPQFQKPHEDKEE